MPRFYGFSLRKFILLTTTMCYAIFGVFLLIMSLQLQIDLSDDFEPTSKIVADWNTVPFVDLITVRSDQSCPSGTDLVLWKPWLGTVPYCVCYNGQHWRHKRGACLADQATFNWSYDVYYCAELEALAPVI